MSWRKLIVPLSAVPVLLLLAYGFTLDPRAVPSPLVGKAAPDFAIETFEGKRLALVELKGRVVVVNFWASWCYPACYDEAPVFEAGWRAYRDQGVTVVGINIQDTEAKARAFIEQFRLTFPNGPDPQGKISIDYGVYGVPETFFID
ncbi:MAG: TlpA family protein disulfide reductase, partial [Candidatus Methylomirabilales bacterium]